jgi:hypothetical protein
MDEGKQKKNYKPRIKTYDQVCKRRRDKQNYRPG